MQNREQLIELVERIKKAVRAFAKALASVIRALVRAWHWFMSKERYVARARSYRNSQNPRQRKHGRSVRTRSCRG